MLSLTAQSTRFSRRELVGAGLAATALLPLGTAQKTLAGTSRPTLPLSARAQAASASPDGWMTWYLRTPDELRPAAPGSVTESELAEVLAMQAEASDASVAAIARWGDRPAVLAWTDVARGAFIELGFSPVMVSRANALLQTAMADAAIAAWDAQIAHARPGPAASSDAVSPAAGVDPAKPSFPSEHAAVAGAAATVLGYALPEAAPERFAALAQEAAESRIAAGAAFRSDIEAGLALGQAIGAKAVERGKSDGSDATWDGESGRLSGDGYWVPTPPDFVESPALPLAGTWRTWVLPSGDAIRPGPPPSHGSPAWEAQLGAVHQACEGRSLDQEQAAHFWDGTKSGDYGVTIWSSLAADEIIRHGLDLPAATRVLSLVGAAIYDAYVATWDAKYHYWMARPITADPDLDLLFGTPPHPSYPSGHAALSGAAAATLASLFPEDQSDLLALAAEAAASRCWAGIHFPIDDDIGLALGYTIGHMVSDFARTGGTR